jgi:MFS family permease
VAQAEQEGAAVRPRQLSLDFWKFWVGQTVSNLGNSITLLAAPLAIYDLTGSAVNLALMSVAQMTPYIFFGLWIGAWVDRVDRRRLMISADIVRALIIMSIPVLSWQGSLSVWWIYVVGFVNATISIAFDASEFAAIPGLVDSDDLVTANGRIQASYSAATIIGPLVAGALITVMSVESIFTVDAATFIVSAAALWLVRASFNAGDPGAARTTTIRDDVREGLSYVFKHPVLRNISFMMLLVNFFGATAYFQLVLFAHERLSAGDSRLGPLYASGSVGVLLISMMAGRLRHRWSFSRVALSALVVSGAGTFLFAWMTNYWAALPIWAIIGGANVLFNINTSSLRQTIIPNHLLGRVMSVAMTMSSCAVPFGALLGGYAIEQSSVRAVYAAIGAAVVLIALLFSLGPVGRANRYLAPAASASAPVAAQ